MLGENITMEDLHEATKAPTIKPRFLEILKIGSEAAGADRVDLVFVTGSYTQQARGYWESNALKEAVASSGLKIQVVDSRTDSIIFDEQGQNVMQGPLNTQGKREIMLVKDGFVPQDAVYIGDKEEEGNENLEGRLVKKGVTFFSVDGGVDNDSIKSTITNKVSDSMVAHHVDKAALAKENKWVQGGIDMNAVNMAMVIKRDGKGVPLPLAKQDMTQLARIGGFEPHILEIRPASSLNLFGNPANH